MKDLRSSALRSLALAATMLLLAGCQSSGRYFSNRLYDFEDMFHVGVGATAANDYSGIIPPTLGVYAQVTEFGKLGAITHNGVTAEIDHRGIGAYPESRTRIGLAWWEAAHISQLYDRGATCYFKTPGTMWQSRMNSRPKWCAAPPKEYVYDHWDSDLQYGTLLMHDGWQHILDTDFEIGICEPFVSKLGATVRFGFDVSEIGDFVTGWFGLDMYGDDLTPEEYAEMRGLKEPAVKTQEPVAQAVTPLPAAPVAPPKQEIVISELPSHILFQSGSAVITNDGKALLRKLAGDLRAKYAGRQIIVEGDTDSQPIKQSKWASNWDLGAMRAAAVVNFLVKSCGVPDSQVEQARTFSDHRPVADNSTAAGRQQNRRTVILVKTSK